MNIETKEEVAKRPKASRILLFISKLIVKGKKRGVKGDF
jgi:hypothetical protein